MTIIFARATGLVIRRGVLARVRRLTGGLRSPRGGLTYLAAVAYLRGPGREPT